LTQIQENVDSVAGLPVKWADQLKELLRENERPPISELSRLLAIAETSGELLDEMVDLKAFLNEAGHLIENISRIFGKQRGRNSDINSGLSEVEKLFGSEKTLSNFRLLLAKANQMALECPEIHILNDAICQAEEYQGRLKHLLNDRNASLTALNDMYNEAIKLDIGIEEFFELVEKKRCAEWEENAKMLVSGKEEEIKSYTEMIKSGLEIGITQDHPQMVTLTKIKSVADEWRDQAHNIFRLSKFKIESLLEIEQVLLDGKLTPYYKATMQQLQQLYDSIKTWYLKASEIFEIKHSSDTLVIGKLKTQNYELVKQLLMESESLSMSLEIPEILETIAVTETWLQRGKKVLCRPRSSKSFQMVLSDLLKNVEIFANTHIPLESVCFCRAEVKDQLPVQL
jgi:hypothetical protein